jgi:hypothetical protein
MQSGNKYAHQWQITWKQQERWSNPLMGWTSSADPMSSVKVRNNQRKKEDARVAMSFFYFILPCSYTSIFSSPIFSSLVYQLNFNSEEEAVKFANRNGWKYEVRADTTKSNVPLGFTHYKHNFLAKRVRAKPVAYCLLLVVCY